MRVIYRQSVCAMRFRAHPTLTGERDEHIEYDPTVMERARYAGRVERMKILHCSDPHGDRSTAGLPRLADIEKAVEQTVRAAVDESVDLYCLTGDLADPDSGSVVLRVVDLFVRTFLELVRHRVKVVVVAGNHDVAQDGHGTTTLTAFRHLGPAVHIFEQPGIIPIDPGWLFALPYPSLAVPYDPAETLAAFKKTRCVRSGVLALPKIVVAHHLQLRGITEGDETTEMARGRDVPFPHEKCEPDWLILGGHYHERQVWTNERGVRVHIAGSLARLAHGEERNRPSFQIWTI